MRGAMLLIMLLLGAAGCVAKQPLGAAQTDSPWITYWQFAITVTDPERVASAYERLGFRVVSRGSEPAPHVVVSDGRLHLRLDSGPFDSPRVLLFGKGLATGRSSPGLYGLFGGVGGVPVYGAPPGPDGAASARLIDPTGLHVWGVEWPRPYLPTGIAPSLLGEFTTITRYTSDANKTQQFWKRGQFEARTVPMPHPCVLVEEGALRIQFHQAGQYHNQTALVFQVDDVARQVEALQAIGLSPLCSTDASGRLVQASLQMPGGHSVLIRSRQ